MGPTQVYTRLVSYFESFKKLLRDTIGAYLLKEWKHTEKENIVPVDETMLPEILRIQAEGFDGKNQENLIKYSKKLRKIFYVIKNQDKIAGYCIYYLKPELSFKGLEKKSVVYSIAIDKKFREKGIWQEASGRKHKGNEAKRNILYSPVCKCKKYSCNKVVRKNGFSDNQKNRRCMRPGRDMLYNGVKTCLINSSIVFKTGIFLQVFRFIIFIFCKALPDETISFFTGYHLLSFYQVRQLKGYV